MSQKRVQFRRLLSLSLGLLVTGLGGYAQADEGMWLFNNLPKAQLKKQHNFRADR